MTGPPTAPRVFAVVPAAGRGERFGAELPKQYAPLLGATVLEWSLRALLREPRIQAIAVPLTAGDARGRALIARLNDSRLRATVGGVSRHESVRKGLDALESLAGPDDWILVHDAARPCLAATDVAALIDALEPVEAAPAPSGAMLAAPIFDTVKRERDGVAAATVDRRGLWRALTPQVFGFAPLKRALDHASASQVVVTDEAQAMEAMGFHPRLVEGSAFNIKVTRPDDLAAAARILKHTQGIGMRVGQGFDVHTFGEGDHVMLGGVRIAHHRGVVAHSDGDVVIHALCDAVLGALGQGDIGRHFPDTDPRYRGADSRTFLRHVALSMRSAGYALVNADLTVLAEAPRIAPHRAAMAENLAADLGVSPERINVKATTTERLGFVGRGEGLAASAAVLLEG